MIGVPQRSFLDPVWQLINIFIDDLKDESEFILHKFAVGTKMGGIAGTL